MIKAMSNRLAAHREWENLTQAQIAARCRTMAASAITLAEESSLDVSIPYLETAEAWTQLANDIEWAARKTALDHVHAGVSAARQLGKVT